MKRLGIIGAGRIVHWFLTDLNNSLIKNQFELFGIWNIHQEKAKSVAEQYQIKNIFLNVDNLLDKKTN